MRQQHEARLITLRRETSLQQAADGRLQHFLPFLIKGIGSMQAGETD